MKTITTIGSLPYIDPLQASQKILEYTPQLPAWPQLPKRSFKENMYVQYSEKFPGIIIDETLEKIFINTEKFTNELENFYQHYIDNDIDYFSISEEYSSGLYTLKKILSNTNQNNNTLLGLKGQIIGPVTFGLSVKDENERAIFYNEQIRDVVLKNCIMKSLWQIKFLSEIFASADSSVFVLFIDEPYLAAYGSAFTAISRLEIISSIKEVVSNIKSHYINSKIKLLVGVHCCANTDWSILLESDLLDIISFDAYEFFENFILYADKIKEFIQKDKILAWGIIPTNEISLEKENFESLKKKLENSITLLHEKYLIDKNKLTQNLLVTPACGIGTKSPQIAEKILTLLQKMKGKFNE